MLWMILLRLEYILRRGWFQGDDTPAVFIPESEGYTRHSCFLKHMTCGVDFEPPISGEHEELCTIVHHLRSIVLD